MAILFIFFTLCFSFFLNQTSSSSFTTTLIHREFSPKSPFYNPSASKFARLQNTFCRSIQSQISSISGEYLMNISIGTPPVTFLGIADTGSDLTWTQCEPCTQCFNQSSPIFDPTKSSTYKTLTCNSKPCSFIPTSSCNPDDDTCQYRYSYGDKSFTNGDLAVDSLTFGSDGGRPISIPNVVFGCGHENGGSFIGAATGIVGLGGGPISIIRQLKNSINGKFSYCLVPLTEKPEWSSKINFGSDAVLSGDGVVTTPLTLKSPNTFYYLTLEKITVGNSTIEYKTLADNGSEDGNTITDGNMIIDSGTTLTMLGSAAHTDLVSKLKGIIGLESTTDSHNTFDLCYKITEGENLNIPTITFHFTGADLDLPESTTFLEVEKGLICLMMIATDDLPIFGNLSQMGFLVGYDLVSEQVSFKPTNCTAEN